MVIANGYRPGLLARVAQARQRKGQRVPAFLQSLLKFGLWGQNQSGSPSPRGGAQDFAGAPAYPVLIGKISGAVVVIEGVVGRHTGPGPGVNEAGEQKGDLAARDGLVLWNIKGWNLLRFQGHDAPCGLPNL